MSDTIIAALINGVVSLIGTIAAIFIALKTHPSQKTTGRGAKSDRPVLSTKRIRAWGIVIVGLIVSLMIGRWLAVSITPWLSTKVSPSNSTLTPVPMITATETVTPVAGITPTNVTTPTSMLLAGKYFEDGCIPSLWTPYQSKLYKNVNGCWQLQRPDTSLPLISAQPDGRLLLSVNDNQYSQTLGVYGPISNNVVIRFKIEIDGLETPSSDAARIAIGIGDHDEPMNGDFLYYREQETPSYASIEFGQTIDNAKSVHMYLHYSQPPQSVVTQNIMISLSGNVLQIFVGDNPTSVVPPTTSVTCTQCAFVISYLPVVKSNVFAFISDLSVEEK
jgi:hypothetical protein